MNLRVAGYYLNRFSKARNHLPLQRLWLESSIFPTEQIFYSLPNLAPGTRIPDCFPDRISYLLDHPSKDSDEFPEWLARFSVTVDEIVNLFPAAFTDGSYSSSALGHLASAAYALHHKDHIPFATATTRLSDCTAIDAELTALSQAVVRMVNRFDGPIHFFTDSESAIRLLFDVRPHTSQRQSITASRVVREWLLRRPYNLLYFHWCPGHSGIKGNERVDQLAGASVASGAPHEFLPIRSLSWARQLTTTKASVSWKALAKQPSYRGHGFLKGRSAITPIAKRGSRLMRAVAKHKRPNQTLARAARATLNHAPTGEFRERFFPHLPTACNTCGVTQTRAHILNRCTRYKRSCLNFLEFLKNSAHPESTLIAFLDENPLAFTFEDAPSSSP